MKKAKVVVEINSERHRLVHGRKPLKGCDQCSLEKYCVKCIGSPCLDSYDYFKLEKQ